MFPKELWTDKQRIGKISSVYLYEANNGDGQLIFLDCAPSLVSRSIFSDNDEYRIVKYWAPKGVRAVIVTTQRGEPRIIEQVVFTGEPGL